MFQSYLWKDAERWDSPWPFANSSRKEITGSAGGGHDVSEDMIAVAKKNAEKENLADRVDFCCLSK